MVGRLHTEEGGRDRHCSLWGTRAGRQHPWLWTKEEQFQFEMDFPISLQQLEYCSALHLGLSEHGSGCSSGAASFGYSRISLSMNFSPICVQKVKVEITGRRERKKTSKVRTALTSGIRLLTSSTECPVPDRPGMAIRPAAAAAAAAGIARGASAPGTLGTVRPGN